MKVGVDEFAVVVVARRGVEPARVPTAWAEAASGLRTAVTTNAVRKKRMCRQIMELAPVRDIE
jgi:hypothetical protein